MNTKKKTKKMVPQDGAPQTNFRFKSIDHYDLVHRAKDHAGLSLNAWMIQATLKQAREELGEK